MMTRVTVAVVGLTLLVGIIDAAAQGDILFTSVNVVSMDSGHIVRDQSVLIRNGTIAQISQDRGQSVPPGGIGIDGSGLFLAPGLADLHVHLMGDETELLLYLANGVTTIRDLSGQPRYLEWRDEIQTAARRGPNLILAGPIINRAAGLRPFSWYAGLALIVASLATLAFWRITRKKVWPVRGRQVALGSVFAVGVAASYPLVQYVAPMPDGLMPRTDLPRTFVGSPWETAATVRRIAARYDNVKLYDGLSGSQFRSATLAAARNNIWSVGHVPLEMTLHDAMESGLDELAHVYFLVEALGAADTSGFDREAASDSLDRLVATIRDEGVAVTTTLVPFPELLQFLTDEQSLGSRVDLPYRHPANLEAFRRGAQVLATDEYQRWLRAQADWAASAVQRLVRTGVVVGLGTDTSPRIGTAGFSVHDELALIIDSGLSPYEALQTATIHARRIGGGSEDWGRVTVGARADLVLLADNPLEDVSTMRQPIGVMARGRWYDRVALDAMLDSVRQRRARP